jgi:serine/threonine-protein kinase
VDIALYQRAQVVFEDVLDLPLSARAAALDAGCGEDAALRALVVELLEREAEADEDELDRIAPQAAAAELPVALQPGVHVGRFVVLRLLGVGGTAQVWEVMHRVLGSRQALKVLTWAEPSLQRRLLREARAQASLVHPNLVPVHDIIDVHGAPGLIMPVIDGPALDELLDGHRLERDAALALFTGIVEGVAHAHAQGLVHRDLKPGNVLLDLQGEQVLPRVTDFGLVKGGGQRTVTQAGDVMGTLSYASPEQLRDTADADARSDLWSLGVMLVELVTGQRPFRGRLLADILDQHQDAAERVAATMPAELQALTAALLQVDPARRPADCGAVLAALPVVPPGPQPGLREACAEVIASPEYSRPPVDLHTLSAIMGDDSGPLVSAPEAPAPPEPPPAAPLPAPSQRARRLPWLAATTAALGLGLALWWSGGTGPGPAEPVPQDDVTESILETSAPDESPAGEPVAAPEPAPEEAPAPARTAAPPPRATAPRATAPRPTPPPEAAPQAAPQPAPPTAPAPAPEPAVEDEPPPEAPPAPARVTVTGAPDEVRIISAADQRIHAPGPVPPGRYRLEARFPGRGTWFPLELGSLAPGASVTVHCDESFGMCRRTSG